jgi:hypothetical protein
MLRGRWKVLAAVCSIALTCCHEQTTDAMDGGSSSHREAGTSGAPCLDRPADSLRPPGPNQPLPCDLMPPTLGTPQKAP